MQMRLDELLCRVVERKGYAVQGSDAEGLFARRGNETLLVAWKTNGPLQPNDATMFLTAMQQTSATAGVVVVPRGAEPTARDACAAAGIEIWGESRLVVEVGEAFVKAAVDAHAAAPTAAAPAAPAAPAPVAAHQHGNAPAPTGNQRRFPSLIATAVSSTASDTRGAAYYLPSKPRERSERSSESPLAYAWSGMGASAASSSHSGVAHVTNGRRPRAEAPAPAPAPTAAARPAPTPMIVPEHDDVEITSTPRRQASAAPVAAPVAPVAPMAAPAPQAEAYEILPSRRAPTPPPPATSMTPGNRTLPIDGGVAAPAQTLRVAVTRAEAEQRARAKIGNPTGARLALIPHIAFRYDAHIERPGMPLPIDARGVVLASGVTGELRALDALAFSDAVPEEPRKDAQKLQAVDVYDRVKGHLAKAYTKEFKVEREVGGTTVMENSRIVPTVEELGLEHHGVVHVPVWEVTGSSGTARVDGISGDVA